MPHTQKISFIGAGRMAEAIIKGMISSGTCLPDDATLSDRDSGRLSEMARKYGINAVPGNIEAVNASDTVILAVKPQAMREVLEEISGAGISKKLFISIAAGISMDFLERKLPSSRVVRVMPNAPCLVGKGMSVMCKGRHASDKDMDTAGKIFSALGRTLITEEEHMDAVTGLSGSGPAFVYSAIKGMIKGGELSGLSGQDAKTLALQTFLGSVATMEQSGASAAELIDMVASPGGTTVEGLKVLEKYKFEKAMEEAVVAAARRAGELK
jgi:pyrroline-5-carboxylate reductase